MSLLFETIRLQNRQLHNLWYHSERMAQSQKDLLGIEKAIDLETAIRLPDEIGEGLYRCRVSYKEKIDKIAFFPYEAKHPSLIQLVENPLVSYHYKFEDRSQFQELLAQHPWADDVIITHNNYLTDATFANLAFSDGNQWFTPATPLLKGTRRQYLIDKQLLVEKAITTHDLKYFRQFALINAMRDFNIIYDFTFSNNQLIVHGIH